MKIESYLSELRLSGMLNRWQALSNNTELLGLSFQEGLELLLQAEAEHRTRRKQELLTKNANFRYQASVGEIEYIPQRNLNKTTLVTLADCSFIQKGQIIAITGATGCGKSFLGSALGQQACGMGYKTLYVQMGKLMTKLLQAKAQGTYIKEIENIAKHKLLVIDDFGLFRLDRQQSLDFMEIIEDRHSKNATIIISQLPIVNWYDLISENTIADAIMDRIVHNAIRIELMGESLRKKK